MLTADQSQRQQALDPSRSFIVQAPAGSGKTELLVQRFLVLLAHVQTAPEEIIAITFTRKAAAEMRQRILEALRSALLPAPTESAKYQTWQLAHAALEKDRQEQWDLLNNPGRLYIQTIDSFCHSLTRRMPLLSGLGAEPTVVEDATIYYLQAARALLNTLEENEPWSNALERLLFHLDNQHSTAENLLVGMLMRRDQWLPHLVGHSDQPNPLRQKLEAGLAHIVMENLNKCYRQVPLAYRDELITIARFAAMNLVNSASNKNTKEIIHCLHLQQWPEPILNNYSSWLGLAQLLLTQPKDAPCKWRSQITSEMGFPSKDKDAELMKKRLKALIKQLESDEKLRQYLQDLLESPPAIYSHQQWEMIEALIELLPLLAAKLTLVFRQTGVVDFCEIATCALRALGEPESPTELALYLDHQIRHLLVDEFQDTSMTQFRLLEQLVAGWQPEDGRTLFLVGDPMQSIYRFREAEVGLFLKAKADGIDAVKLEPLTLTANFRSVPDIIDWANQHFDRIFPTNIDISSGAVPFNPSIACVPATDQQAVFTHAITEEDESITANKVVNLIQQERHKNPQGTIAILVRSRNHLTSIIPALKKANLNYAAVEIEKLAEQSIILDLFALTSALLQLADRLSWLTVLRAPWCGLTLADMHALASVDLQKPLWDIMQNADSISRLSADGQQRLNRIKAIFAAGLAQRRRYKLRQWIEGIWWALGGPACLSEEVELTYAKTFFHLLEELDTGGEIMDFTVLEDKINKLCAQPDSKSDLTLQVMTIHKAKGLEFDTVIIPHLERKSPYDENQLLMWLDRARQGAANDLILAPIKSIGEDHDPIYHYLRHIEKIKNGYEIARLFYVATTRAKKNLHLITHIPNDGKILTKPTANSFLALLWNSFKPLLEAEFSIKTTQPITANNTLYTPRPLKRLSTSWSLPATNQSWSLFPTPFFLAQTSADDSSTQDNMASQIGTVIHRCLQQISQQSEIIWNPIHIQSQRPLWKKWLLQSGIHSDQLELCLTRIETALIQTLQDPRGQWILDHRHQNAQSEYSMTALLDGALTHFIIDRTFVDEKNTRWIIDYKTSDVLKGDAMIFLEQQQALYQPQLEKYAKALRLLDNRPIALGLYFPLFGGWREWSFEG